jgi:phosphatidylinositol dimannoside acyltransferase
MSSILDFGKHLGAGAVWRRMAYWGSRYGPEPWLRHGPTALGWLFGALSFEQRLRVRNNLRRVYGVRGRAAEELDILRTFVSYAHCLAESLAAERPQAGRVRYRVHGEHHLRLALDAGRGLVVVTAHLGPWDVAARLLRSDWGVDVMTVMQREADPGATEVHDRIRRATGVRAAYMDHPLDGLEMLSHLRRRGAVAMQLDRLPRGTRATTGKLFGEPFGVPEGPFLLAGATGAPWLPVFTRRLGYFDYELRVHEARSVPRRPDPGIVEAEAQVALTALEQFVRDCPTQWFHFEPDRTSASSLERA